MEANTEIKDREGLDPVFLKYGQEVYTYDHVRKLREKNVELKKKGKRLPALIPQEGFQERVLLCDSDIVIAGGRRGLGKVLSNDSDIITPFGIRKNGDLKVGDTITNPCTGGFEKVIAIYEHPKHVFYEIIFDDGATVECGLEHLWKIRVDGSSEYRVWTFDMIKRWLDKRDKEELYIPLTRPVHFYDDDVFLSVADRSKLIRDQLEQDGLFDNGYYIYKTTFKTEAEDFHFRVLSLGYKAKMEQIGEIYRVSFNPTENERKIIGYRHIGIKDGRCITVDSPDSLYMTNDFIVTHNTFVGLFKALPYIFNPEVNMYGFRKYEADISRGIWKSSKQVFREFGNCADTTFTWQFLNGTGATMTMEHLQDPKKVKDRFRGVEMAYILIEELAEHTRDDLDVLFNLLTSNRSTAGVRPQCVCTCNPVGKSNKLRLLLDWWIDPDTDRPIPERDGAVRYFYRWGSDVSEMVWGDSPEEVYNNQNAHDRIKKLCDSTGADYHSFVTSMTFITGEFNDNKILQVSDPKYLARVTASGGETTSNDIEGVWRDVDTGSCLVSTDVMQTMFDNTEQRDGFMRASADVAITGDFFVIYAFDGHHICAMDAWRGVATDRVVPFIRNFLKMNGVREENFTYDSNGLGLWLKDEFPTAVPFNNKSTSSDTKLWNNLKSESAEKFIKALKAGEFSIEQDILEMQFTDKKKHTFKVRDRIMNERLALKRKDTDNGRFEIISKPQMKVECGESPDFIEAMFMVMPLFERKAKKMTRMGFENW